MESRTKFYGTVLAMLTLSSLAVRGFPIPARLDPSPRSPTTDEEEPLTSSTNSNSTKPSSQTSSPTASPESTARQQPLQPSPHP